MTRYLLPESTVVIDGKVDLIHDTRLGDDDTRVYLGASTATVATSVRADSRHGSRTMDVPERGDNSVTFEWTADQRLTGVSFNSAGVGSKVVAAGVKIVAMVVGTAVRLAGNRFMMAAAESLKPSPNTDPPTPDEAREAWEEKNEAAAAHGKSYSDLANTATTKLLAARNTMLTSTDTLDVAKAARQVNYLEHLLADAKAEVAKVQGLIGAWSTARMTKYPQHLTVVLAIDDLPVHEDPTSYEPSWKPADPSTNDEQASVVEHIWETLGVLVEIGPVSDQDAYRPNPDGRVEGTPNEQSINWRVPRLARLWVWRRNARDKPVLEQLSEILVTDRFSKAGHLKLEGRWFGEQAAQITLNDLGVPTKLVTGDKSAVGAIADAISAAPDQFTAGLDAVSKASTALGDLSSAGAELRLKAIKRQVEQRTQELALEGLNATAEEFAELKRLTQQVEIATAQGSLAPPSELVKFEAELARETARRDLEAVRRDRAQTADMAAVRSEIDVLKAELELLKLREATDQAKEPKPSSG